LWAGGILIHSIGNTCSLAATVNTIIMANENASLTMKMRHVSDAESGLAAFTYLAPGGWDIQDNVVWDRTNIYNPAHLFVHCYNNDGLTIQLRAGYVNRYWSNPFGNSGNTPPRDVTKALMIYLPWLRGVPVEFTEATILSSTQQPGMLGYYNNTKIIQQYGRIRGHYVKDGFRFDEIVYATLTLTHIKQPPDFTGFFYEDISWDINDLFLSSASGHHDPEAGVATAFSIKSSVRQTQAFYDYERQMVSLLQQQYQMPHSSTGTTNTIPAASGSSTKSAHDIMKETNEFINKTNEEIRIKDRENSDKRHEQAIDGIRGVERYTDGQGTEYTLPTGYGSSYVSSIGTVVMVDKNNPDPDLYDTSYETWKKIFKKKY
jgi:hypothetical protein